MYALFSLYTHTPYANIIIKPKYLIILKLLVLHIVSLRRLRVYRKLS